MEDSNYTPTFAEPTTDWFKWFAWRPVNTVDRGWRWLRPVWKRRCQTHNYLPGPMMQYYQYALAAQRKGGK